MNYKLHEIFLSVKSPWRYIGGEVFSRVKPWDNADVRVCLAFPDVYEIGMSHLGLSILYHIINDEPRLLAERVFAPWEDMEAELLKHNMPLFSLESQRSVSDFDILGFSLAYELTYTNVLNMLKLAGIPIYAKDRLSRPGTRDPEPEKEIQRGFSGSRVPVPGSRSLVLGSRFPVVIAGGPCTFNPMPVAPFFDAIVIGDGENVILEIANTVGEWKKTSASKMELLECLSKIRGIYVSIIHGFRIPGPGSRVPAFTGKSTIPDLSSAPFPTRPVIPHKATQERLAVEVARGCTRGCRFCQAGYIYRPARQREAEIAVTLACEGVRSSGADEFSFLSLSLGDWAPLEGALGKVFERIAPMPANASLPSLRAESLTQGIVENLGRERAGSFTLAPEAATERMRKAINKGNTDDDLYSSVEKVFSNGWHAVKLYFMLGLPGETDAEIDGIVRIANRCLDIGRRYHRRPEVTVSTSTFVPKAHTPFQWEEQISVLRTEEVQKRLKREISRRGLFYRWHDARMSFLEGVFSRGGIELAPVIEKAHASGARFDSWDENFDIQRWNNAFSECGIEPEIYLKERPPQYVFPWEFLEVGPSREFLERERTRASELTATPDCSREECSACGMCDFREVKNRVEQAIKLPSYQAIELLSYKTTKYRLRYKKTGRSAFLGSIETLDALRRALRASQLPICYSEGYHPRALVSAGPALSLGIESECEFLDVELEGQVESQKIVEVLSGHLPDGMEVVEVCLLDKNSASIEKSATIMEYEVWSIPSLCKGGKGRVDNDLPHLTSPYKGEVNFIPAVVDHFNATATVPFTRMRGERARPSCPQAGSRGGQAMELDLKEYVAKLAVLPSGVLEISLRNIKPSLKVSEVVAKLFDISDDDLKKMYIKKVNTCQTN